MDRSGTWRNCLRPISPESASRGASLLGVVLERMERMDVEALCAELAGSTEVEVATKRRRRRPNWNTRGGRRHKSLGAKRVLQRAAEDEEYYGAQTTRRPWTRCCAQGLLGKRLHHPRRGWQRRRRPTLPEFSARVCRCTVLTPLKRAEIFSAENHQLQRFQRLKVR